jgi:hypothetical protein
VDGEEGLGGNPQIFHHAEERRVDKQVISPGALCRAIGRKASGLSASPRPPSGVRAKVFPTSQANEVLHYGQVVRVGIEVARDGDIGVAPLKDLVQGSLQDGVRLVRRTPA